MKKIKKTFIIIFLLSIFFSFNVNAKAYDAYAYYCTNSRPDPNNSEESLYYQVHYKMPYVMSSVQSGNPAYPWQDKKISGISTYSVQPGGTGPVYQAFCIQPGTDLAKQTEKYGTTLAYKTYTGYNFFGNKLCTDKDSCYLYSQVEIDGNESATKYPLDGTKRQMIRRILTLAKKLDKPCGTNGVVNATYDETDAVYAAQALIWEVILGQRTEFVLKSGNEYEKYKPQNLTCGDRPKDANKCIKENESFYYVLTHADSKYKLDTILSSYKDLIEKYVEVYEKSHKNFYSTGSAAASTAANAIEVEYDESSDKWIVPTDELADVNTKYWDVTAEPKDGVIISTTNGNLGITITDEKLVGKDIKINLTIKGANKKSAIENTAFYSPKSQDVAILDAEPRDLTATINLKAKPLYSLEITKVDEDDNTKLLDGAEFDICTNERCTKDSIIDSVSVKNGKALYESLPEAKKYYLKETKFPKGYEDAYNGKTIPVEVTEANRENNPAKVTIENKPIIVNLDKYTVDDNGNQVLFDDNCESGNLVDDSKGNIGPKFKITDSKGKKVCFKLAEGAEFGEYVYASCDDEDAIEEISTCEGKFNVKTLPECKYTVEETKLPEGVTIKSDDYKQQLDICNGKRTITLTNGFAGVEFQKKDETGNLLSGGKYALQMKDSGIYTEKYFKKTNDGMYELTSDGEGSTEIETNNGTAYIKGLGPGEYRFVEKEPPEGYDKIEAKDSKSTFTISAESKDEYYLVEMVDRKSIVNGSEASAELIVTITTGRKIINYVVVFGLLGAALVIAFIIRKKIKK